MGGGDAPVKRWNRANVALHNPSVLCYKPRASAKAGQNPYFCYWDYQPATGGKVIVNVVVRDNNVDQALKALKKKMQREGVFREMKLRRSYEKPSERKAREKAEAVRRHRKLLRKRMDREGY
jgi:small subunit ribosomal protein S21